MAGTAAETANKGYANLSANFFRGQPKGQIDSIYRDREAKPEKLKDFKNALKAGDVTLGKELTEGQAAKLKEMGIKVPDTVTVKAGRQVQAAQPAA